MKKYGKYEKMPDGTRAKQPPVKSMLLQTYFTSLLCLVLCVTMFFGTSYAWFTSEVNNEGNEIYIGTLDVELQKQVPDGADADADPDYVSLSEKDDKGNNITKLFDSGIRWEPGYTALETVKVVNEGDLAFKYELSFTDGKVNGTEDNELLAEAAKNFVVYVHAGDYAEGENAPMSFIDIEKSEKWVPVKMGEEVATLADILEKGLAVFSGEMKDVRTDTADPTAAVPGPNDSKTTEVTYIIALHMKENADSSVMGHKISLNVKLAAYQMSSEKDGFDGPDYDQNAYPGEVTFVSTAEELQEALDNATGDAIIQFANDVEGNVTAAQKADVRITIDGNGHELNGTITVDGKSSRYDNAALTIKNVNFDAESVSTGAYINLGVSGDTNTRYADNVTVENCTFKGNGIVAVKSYTGGDRNLTITGCTVMNEMHSLAQIANVEERLVIENCEVYSKNGANVNQSANVTIRGCTFDVTGYAVRFGASSGDTSVAEIYLIEKCTLKSACEADDDAVIILRGTADGATLTLTDTTIEGERDISNSANATVKR